MKNGKRVLCAGMGSALIVLAPVPNVSVGDSDLNTVETQLVLVLNRNSTACDDCEHKQLWDGPDPIWFHKFNVISEEPSIGEHERAVEEDALALTSSEAAAPRSGTVFDINKACFADPQDSSCHNFYIEGDCDWHPGCEEEVSAARAIAKQASQAVDPSALLRAVAANSKLRLNLDAGSIDVTNCAGKILERTTIVSSVHVALLRLRLQLS